MRNFVPASILVFTMGLIAAFAQGPLETHFREGDAAPNFEVTALDGTPLKLEELRGKIVVLNFWFIACPPCRSEMPLLNDLVSRFSGRDVVFIAFAADPAGPLEEFLEHHEFHYQIIPDATPIAERYGVKGAPTHMILDRDGRFSRIIYGAIGDVELDLLEPIEKLLNTEDSVAGYPVSPAPFVPPGRGSKGGIVPPA